MVLKHSGPGSSAAPLLMFFRHWTAGAALRAGISLPPEVAGRFGPGLP